MTRVGLSLPQTLSASETRRYTELAIDAGADSLWVLEQPADRIDLTEPLITLALAATVPSTIGLGAAVLLGAARNPLVLARQLASLQRLSGGRVVAGVGVGEVSNLFDAGGVAFASRAARLEETVTLLRNLLAGGAVAHSGRFFTYDGPGARPQLEDPPPIWFGGRHPNALARAARLGDGWIGAGSTSSAAFVDQSRRVRELAGDRPFTIAKRVYVTVDDKPERGWQRLEAFCAALYGDASIARRVGVAGPVGSCADQLGALARATPDLIVLNPVDQPFDQLERLAGLL